MNGTIHKRSTSNNYVSPSSLIVKSIIKTPINNVSNSLLNKYNNLKKPSLTPTRENKNFSISGNTTQRITTTSQSKSKSSGRSNKSDSNFNTNYQIKLSSSNNRPVIPVSSKPGSKNNTGTNFYKPTSTTSPLINPTKISDILNMNKKSPNLSYLNSTNSTRTKSPNNGSKNSTPKSITEKLNNKSPSSLIRSKIVKPSIDLHQTNYSIDKSTGSYSPNSVDGKIKVTRSSTAKSPTNQKNNIQRKVSPINKIKPVESNSSKIAQSLLQNKNSLLKQYEELKNRSISPLYPINNFQVKKSTSSITTNNLSNSSKLEEKTVIKFGARGTIQVSQPEYLIKMMHSENKEKDRENKFNTSKNFKDNNTSPLILRRKSNENEINSVNNKNINKTLSTLKEKSSNNNINFQKSEDASSESKVKKKIKSIYDLSRMGFSGAGVKKYNQDNLFIFKNFNDDPDNIFMSVCDGHGMWGHEVSAYLREHLPVVLNNEFKNKKISLSDSKVNKVIEETFVLLNSRLFNDATMDTNFSGSTCVSVIYSPEKIICANVGDSRAVLGRYINGIWTSHNLSRDHKPNEKDEASRIKRRGGRIEPYRDENDEFVGPERVWLKNEDIPGLAMTRSFGDQIAASVGILAEPEINEWKLTNEDKFMVLASDGVWEFIESEECVNIIKDYYVKNDAQGACEYLVKESAKRWMTEEEVIDDTTLILVFFE